MRKIVILALCGWLMMGTTLLADTEQDSYRKALIEYLQAQYDCQSSTFGGENLADSYIQQVVHREDEQSGNLTMGELRRQARTLEEEYKKTQQADDIADLLQSTLQAHITEQELTELTQLLRKEEVKEAQQKLNRLIEENKQHIINTQTEIILKSINGETSEPIEVKACPPYLKALIESYIDSSEFIRLYRTGIQLFLTPEQAEELTSTVLPQMKLIVLNILIDNVSEKELTNAMLVSQNETMKKIINCLTELIQNKEELINIGQTTTQNFLKWCNQHNQ